MANADALEPEPREPVLLPDMELALAGDSGSCSKGADEADDDEAFGTGVNGCGVWSGGGIGNGAGLRSCVHKRCRN